MKTCVLLSAAVLLLCGMLANQSLQTPMNFDNLLEFEVRQGDNAKNIIESLLSHQIIKSDLPMRIRLKLLKLEKSLQAGVYEVRVGDSAEDLLNKMTRGESKLFSVTFVEGQKSSQYIEILKKTPGVLSTNLLSNSTIDIFGSTFPDCGFESRHIEGRFFPDTYFFASGTTDVQILERAAYKMCEVIIEAWGARLNNLPYKSPYEGLILASIIEKESSVAEEVPIISGVFVRRLKKGMRLQADPTVIYGRDSGRSGRLTKEDLRADTAYNTYTRPGLPLTPIATPSKASICAAFRPMAGDELYFVSKGDGTHYFSTNLVDHKMAVNKFQRGISK